MFYAKIIYLFVFSGGCSADWVEIPQRKQAFNPPPTLSESSIYSGTKTPVNIVFHKEQIENLEGRNVSIDTKRMTTEGTVLKRIKSNRITSTPAKTSIMGVFTSTTQFTPLMSSVNLPTNPTTESTVLKKITELRQNKAKDKESNKKKMEEVEEIVIEDYDEHEETNGHGNFEEKSETEQVNFSSFTGFLPFLKAIQSTLMQKAQKSIKSKIDVLKNLRDNLLYDIDQRLRNLWSRDENKSARGYKEESHMEFPSNEGALMTIGFLTLAVFLVKLVLYVINAIKNKRTTTTTAVTTVMPQIMIGRRKRFITPDVETTYKILSSIENFGMNSWN